MKAVAMVAAAGLMLGGATAASAQEGMSEGRARMLMMEACGNVSTLSRDAQGMWHGSCAKGNMMVNAEGKVVEDKGGAGWLTEAHARSIASESCGNVSALRLAENNTWVGMCSKGTVMVEQNGKVTTR